MEKSPLCLSPIVFFSAEDLKKFFERTFPGLTKYKTSLEKFSGSLYIYFEWEKIVVEICMNKGVGVYIFDKKQNNFIQLLIRKQLQIDQFKF